MSAEDLREPTLLVLTALTAGPRHGYALIEVVGELSGGRVRLKPGSLYATLERLAREGLVTESGVEIVSGRQRRYFELTEEGADALAAQVERLEALASTAAEGLRRHRSSRSRSGVGRPALGGAS